MKNLIFDVGGVLLGYRVVDLLMEERGLDRARARKVLDDVFDSPYWRLSDYGVVTRREVIDGVKRLFPEEADDAEWLISHPFEMIVPRPEVYRRVHELKARGFGLYLLSNYSEDFFTIQVMGLPVIADLDGRLVSYEVCMIKPETRIYQTFLDKYHLDPADCFFFDDRPENIDGAKRAGIDGIVTSSEAELLEALDRLPEKPV